jgi:hypothetical protein
MDYSLLSTELINIPVIGPSFPNTGGVTVSSGAHCPSFMEKFFRSDGSESILLVYY